MTERWLPIVGYEGLYEVSDHGRVRGVPRMDEIEDSLGRRYRRPIGGNLIKPFFRNEYPRVNLKKDRKQASFLIHRLMLLTFVGPPPKEDWYGCHNNGEPTDNRLSNLRWASPKSNQADRKAHGTYQCGEDCPPAKLSEREAKEVLRRRQSGELLSSIADDYDISESQVSNIALGRTWRHLRTEKHENS